jgi:hypothetical protein
MRGITGEAFQKANLNYCYGEGARAFAQYAKIRQHVVVFDERNHIQERGKTKKRWKELDTVLEVVPEWTPSVLGRRTLLQCRPLLPSITRDREMLFQTLST